MLWIKEPQLDHTQSVSGTVVMMLRDDCEVTQEDRDLKKNRHGVVLNPQPHSSPNDPLNWPMWRRDLAMLVIGVYSFIVGGQTPILAAVMSTLHKEWDVSLHRLTYLVGCLMLGMGVGSLFFAPTAVKWGKRPIYLISQLVFLAGAFWGANANSFGSLIGARVLCGIGCGPAESLPSATIAEIYFAHERAYRTGLYTLLMLGGKNLVPLATGFIAANMGWHWIFWFLAIIIGALHVLTFFFVHETWWDRTPVPNKRSLNESEMAEEARQQMHRPTYAADASRAVSTEHIATAPIYESTPAQSVDHEAKDALKEEPDPTHSNESAADVSFADMSPPEKETSHRTPFMKNLAVYNGKKSDASWLKIFLRPFFLYLYPSILFSTLLYSLSIVYLSVIAETISSIFTNEPYNFPVTSVGLLYVGTFIGGCLGSAVAGKSSDIIVRWMSRRNHGVYEPEFRLVMVLPVAISTAIGMMGFGWSTFDADHWIVPTVFLGVLGFGTSLGSTVSITYAVDSYKPFAAESLVSLNFFKNLMGFCFGIFVPIFLDNSNLRTSYVVYGAIEIGVCLLAIPLYRYGKVIRHWRDEHNIIRVLFK